MVGAWARARTAGTMLLLVAPLLPTPPAAEGLVASPESPSVVGDSVWEWPTSSTEVVNGFLAPLDPYGAGHRGIDIEASVGETLRAPSEATVTFARMVVDRGVVVLDHGEGVVSSVEPAEALVPVGSHVARGQEYAVVAEGPVHCVEVCVHFGVRVEGAYVSPLLWLGGARHAVLLPIGGLGIWTVGAST